MIYVQKKLEICICNLFHSKHRREAGIITPSHRCKFLFVNSNIRAGAVNVFSKRQHLTFTIRNSNNALKKQHSFSVGRKCAEPGPFSKPFISKGSCKVTTVYLDLHFWVLIKLIFCWRWGGDELWGSQTRALERSVRARDSNQEHSPAPAPQQAPEAEEFSKVLSVLETSQAFLNKAVLNTWAPHITYSLFKCHHPTYFLKGVLTAISTALFTSISTFSVTNSSQQCAMSWGILFFSSVVIEVIFKYPFEGRHRLSSDSWRKKSIYHLQKEVANNDGYLTDFK